MQSFVNWVNSNVKSLNLFDSHFFAFKADSVSSFVIENRIEFMYRNPIIHVDSYSQCIIVLYDHPFSFRQQTPLTVCECEGEARAE